MSWVDALLQRLRGTPQWPPKGQGPIFQQIEYWAALRRSDEQRIRQFANLPWHRDYLISPVPRLIAKAKANLLYGEPCEIRPAAEQDVPLQDQIIEDNGLGAELHRAAMIASSEGECWGRVSVDPNVLDVPIIEFWSRRRVLPHFKGRFVVGATFVTEWEEGRNSILRLLETYEAGAVHAHLFRGSRISLGVEMPLDSYGETQGREPYVATGIPYPLIAFMPNALDDPPQRGYSDFQGLEQRFNAVNETATIGQENMRLAGKKRGFIDGKYLRNGRLPPGEDMFVRSDDQALSGDSHKPLQLLEYDPGTDKVAAWLDATIDTTLNLAGVAPELVGRQTDGGGPQSGTALKLRMIHSLMEAGGTGTHFDRGVRRLMRVAQIVDSLTPEQGGFGRRWRNADADPSVQRGDGLPRDDMEAAQWLVLVTGADAISLEEKLRWIHPDWTDDQRQEELDRLKEEKQAAFDRLPDFGTGRPNVPGREGEDPEQTGGAPAEAAGAGRE